MGFIEFFKNQKIFGVELKPDEFDPVTRSDDKKVQKANDVITTNADTVAKEHVTFYDPVSDIFQEPDVFKPYEPYNSKVKTSGTRIYDNPYKHTAKPLHEKCSVIILAVENTAKIHAYKEEVLKLINRIVEDNKSELFLFLRVGNENKYFDVLSTNDLETEKLPDCLLFSDDSCSDNVKLADALTHISDFVNDYLNKFKYISLKGKNYIADSVRVIFIGTGLTDEDALNTIRASEALNVLRATKNVKAIKYFCINDKDAINAALVGFPIIGHIESNFYK